MSAIWHKADIQLAPRMRIHRRLLVTDSNGATILRGHPPNWRAAKTAFNPPKAKELLKITRTGMRRASFGT